MYKRILVPLDGSERSESILPFVEEIAGPADTEVILLTVATLPAGLSVLKSGVVFPDEVEAVRAKAERALATIKGKLDTRGLRVRVLVTVAAASEVAGEICRVAREEHADLIAMSTHGRTGASRLVFGSVAEGVAKAAPLPLLMIRMAAVSN
jgi:nucleotide-binding universal stress UspA family protein